jgi:hypothetical protein
MASGFFIALKPALARLSAADTNSRTETPRSRRRRRRRNRSRSTN